MSRRGVSGARPGRAPARRVWGPGPESYAAQVGFVAAVAGVALALAAASGPTRPPPFFASVSPAESWHVRFSYRAGCPVRPAQLDVVLLSYWGFDGRAHRGSLIVNRRVSPVVVKVFRRLYAARFPIRRMVPVSVYRGSDRASMAADNTSAFNCRRAVGSAGRRWSAHAYGLAIDVNPVENPYVLGERVLPPAGRRYLDRRRYRPGMALPGGVLVRAFESIGWSWGGRWSSPDYQHFSASGG